MPGTTYLVEANIGIGQISEANDNLDGTGAVVLCFTSALPGTSDVGGSIITSIKIKSTASTTTQGMIRLFIYDGSTYYLLKEIAVPPTQRSSVLTTFKCTIKTKIKLSEGQQIFASTQNADPFNVFIHGYDYGYIACSSTNKFPSVLTNNNTGLVNISTANSNIDGSGTLGTLIVAPTTDGRDGDITYRGTTIKRISVKAEESTTQGLVRIFVNDGTTSYLWGEVIIPARTQSDVIKTFGMFFNAGLVINPGYSVLVSTENAESFNVVAQGSDFSCC